MEKRDAESRVPDLWYYNQYVNGTLALSHGFPSKELAEGFKESVKSARACAPMRNGVALKIEQAKGWMVNGKEFATFADALYYKWTECPEVEVKGVFSTSDKIY